jgi:hypothetical protein
MCRRVPLPPCMHCAEWCSAFRMHGFMQGIIGRSRRPSLHRSLSRFQVTARLPLVVSLSVYGLRVYSTVHLLTRPARRPRWLLLRPC